MREHRLHGSKSWAGRWAVVKATSSTVGGKPSGPHPGKFNRLNGGIVNWDRISGNWKQMTGKMKQQWGKLTDDEFDQIAGNRDQLVGKIQERYGIARDEADRQVRDWESSQRDLT